MAAQPIVILGGFLITGEAYAPMCRWLFTVGAWGWRRLLDRTAALVEELAAGSPTGKVTLIVHSSGGVMPHSRPANGT